MEDTSITGRAYQILRAELITCRLQPGSRLNISSLQSKLSLSQAAVREALSRLTAEGLVEIERHRGFRVSQVSMDGFRELTQAVLTVELPCIRSSIINGDIEWELGLVSAFHRASRTLELVVAGKEDIDAYYTERRAFYEALLAACDNSWLLWSWRLLYTQNTRYRHMYMPLAKFELELTTHHAAFLQAVLARDVERAVAIGLENYERLMQFIEAQNVAEAATVKPARSVKPRVAKAVAGKVAVAAVRMIKPVPRRANKAG
jgi:DNA-binding GntR family transcriptional regulator